ncbi:UPF0149 family protein [Orbaceae bacterium ac157xtp]
MSESISYEQLNNQLKSNQIGVNTAEIHGFLSGILAGGIQDDSWQILLKDMINNGQTIDSTLFNTIKQLYNQVKQQFNNKEFEFQLLLNEATLFTQIDDMANWINHFLLGLGLAQPQLAKIKGDVGEAIYDLRQIALLGYDEDENEEELAFAFEEILEYVRMTAILCFDEFTQTNQSYTLH